MRDKETIDKEIAGLKEEWSSSLGKNCEVYTRIVGYYRNYANFNLGKVEEYNARKEFVVPLDCKTVESMV